MAFEIPRPDTFRVCRFGELSSARNLENGFAEGVPSVEQIMFSVFL
jgi:hypothetical protein